jgi:hypothetical protein
VWVDTGGEPWACIPHDALDGTQPIGMTAFIVGENIHSGSGIYVDPGHTYSWSSVFNDITSPGRSVTWADSYYAPTVDEGGDGFVMLYGEGVSNLQNADVGNWTYVETWTDQAGGTPLVSSTNFTVTPEPATMAFLALGGVAALVRRMRRRGK